MGVQANRGAKAKSITFSDKIFVTIIVLADAPRSFALCESEATATNVFCAKAKRQQQST